MKKLKIILALLLMVASASAQWQVNTTPANADTAFTWHSGAVGIGGSQYLNAKLTVAGPIVQTTNAYFKTARLFVQSPPSIPQNNFTTAFISSGIFWNSDSMKWQINDNDLNSIAMMRVNNGDMNFYVRPGPTNPAPFLIEDSLTAMNVMTLRRGGRVGIGISNPFAKLHIVGNGVSMDTTAVLSGDMLIQANTGGRTTNRGAQLEFVLPAYASGTNPMGQARIIAVAGDNIHGSAVGKMILGTRRQFNKLGTGTNWYYGDDLVIDGKGNIGIGTSTPAKKFTVSYAGTLLDANETITSDVIIQGNTGSRTTTLGAALEFVLPANTDGTNLYGHARITALPANALTGNAAGKLVLGTRRQFNKVGAGTNWYYGDDIVIDGAGNVGIGTLNPQAKFAVNGTILTKQVKVSQSAANWPDYVFAPGYQLPSLDSVAQYITDNKHLPEMPAAKEVETNGQDVGDIQKLMLKKMEEMTLYMIELKKENASLKKRVEELEQRNGK
ncbi:hypothetical protein [Deminuibacter soli]|uniref:BZIP transcription factor n=1 Tax=Deminuibacter soli TaxID=2291815 RepID=A0A3E1NJ38_9BACT|nr:hypothetical protein [Deminuibacter soli]RFM27950.1 hypothetical protein DXN05_10410 [Deminuibacter soli]